MSRNRSLFGSLAAFIVLVVLYRIAAAAELALAVKTIELTGIRADSIELKLVGDALSRLEIAIGKITVGGQEIRNLRLTCISFELGPEKIECSKGQLHGERPMPLAFRYTPDEHMLELSLRPEAEEHWRFYGDFAKNSWSARVSVHRGKLERLQMWLPKQWPTIRSGRANGTFDLSDKHASGKFEITDLQFSDPQGLHAGEKVAGDILLEAQRNRSGWDWQAELGFRKGEVFWSPLYLKGGHRMTAQGHVDSETVRVAKGTLDLEEIGAIDFGASWDRGASRLQFAQASGDALKLPPLYEKIVQPFVATTAAGKLKVEGAASFNWKYSDENTQSFELRLHNASADDKEQRYALSTLNAHIPWQHNARTRGDISFTAGELLRIPFGAARFEPVLEGFAITLPYVHIPVLGGALELADFHAAVENTEWRWRLKAGLSPVPMQALTAALNLPAMHGTLWAIVPEAKYAESTFTVDGTLSIHVFDGAIEVENLSILEPFGLTPRLFADITMRRLDLEQLTRTFSFGSITGAIDVTVDDLVLANWRPIAFDAKLQSSSGNYPRRISQRAVENISALGGAGAAAALQRSFLGLFDEFGYSQIGWSCRLENGVCRMGGIQPAADGYVIVKGGGIPAITVMGYNRRVDWDELIERLKRVTRERPYVVE